MTTHAALPIPPDALRFRVHGDTYAQGFVDMGRRLLDDLSTALAAAGCPWESFGAILDFGCGAGRVLRHLPSVAPHAALWGSDIDAEAIAWCQAHLGGIGVFTVNDPLPPFPAAPDGAFDLAYLVSVFTHLDTMYQRAWIDEMHRVIRPGGILVVTTHGQSLVDSLLPPELHAIAERDGLYFHRTDAWAEHFPDFYQSSYQTTDGMRAAFTRGFDWLYHAPKGLADLQDIVVLRRHD